MQKHLLLIILLISSAFYSMQAMELSLKGMPIEIKLATFNKLLEENSIIPVIKNLHNVRRVDSAFYDIISGENNFKPFIALGSAIKSNNIFTVLDLIKSNPILLQYPDLPNYLQTKFTYLPTGTIKNSLDMLNPAKAQEYTQGLTKTPDAALLDAIRNNDISTIVQLLTLGVDLNSPLIAPLLIAVINDEKDDGKIVRLLLLRGANPNLVAKRYPFVAPLAAAVSFDRLSIAKILLENRANPNQMTEERVPVIVKAAKKNNKAMVQLLFNSGANASPEFLENVKTEVSNNESLSQKEKSKLFKGIDLLINNYKSYYLKPRLW